MPRATETHENPVARRIRRSLCPGSSERDMMSLSRIAVIGADGFIGSRIVESFHLRGWAEIRPVVRRVSAMARSSRFNLDSRIADARDGRTLCAALSGCEYLIHAVGGDDATILGTVGPLFRAAQRAGVRRIVYLSSASVHGQ